MDIESKGKNIARVSVAILVPERALQEPGYIQMMQDGGSGCMEDKHQYQALAQMAYFQHQDQEIEIHGVSAPLKVRILEQDVRLDDGLCIAKEDDGTLVVWQIGEGNVKKLLEAVHRYCTRWVRLDI